MSAAFSSGLKEFASADLVAVLGQLSSAAAEWGFATRYTRETDAWKALLGVLQEVAHSLLIRDCSAETWRLLLEYEIPRRQKRIDAVLLAQDVIFVLEFKVGSASFERADVWQAEDYALDLRDFHEQSCGRSIIPVLVATAAPASQPQEIPIEPLALVYPVQRVAAADLCDRILSLFTAAHSSTRPAIDPGAWERSRYRPTLTIIEAAERLFAQHSVREIAHAFADNLQVTSAALVEAITSSQKERRRTICFVTGVPGAGKTLTGLNAVHDPSLRTGDRPPGVFLSGNGPLVKIVREALTRDRVCAGSSRKEAGHTVSTFIQNVHTFLKLYGIDAPDHPPNEHAIVFDEAQRAWNATRVREKHRRLSCSEPELVIRIMERAPVWATVIALVGGGQEIHKGEAGLAEWGRALASSTAPWQVIASPEVLSGGVSVAGHLLFSERPPHLEVHPDTKMHLAVSVRSPRAAQLAEWVNHVLNNQPDRAREVCPDPREFPLVVSRSLDEARLWLRDRTRHDRRCGLLASSGALRHRAYGLELSSAFRKGYPFEEWFLGPPSDFRSSYQMEVAASEFECQGLELDWVGVCWGDDFCRRPDHSDWHYQQLKGKSWQAVPRPDARRFILNKYRVLLTRAREGMVIWVPPGDHADPTRDCHRLDAMAAYLIDAGVSPL